MKKKGTGHRGHTSADNSFSGARQNATVRELQNWISNHYKLHPLSIVVLYHNKIAAVPLQFDELDLRDQPENLGFSSWCDSTAYSWTTTEYRDKHEDFISRMEKNLERLRAEEAERKAAKTRSCGCGCIIM